MTTQSHINKITSPIPPIKLNLNPLLGGVPVMGDYYVDTTTQYGYVFNGTSWIHICEPTFEASPKSLEPTAEQLEKYPALKQAWDEYMVIRKLLGI